MHSEIDVVDPADASSNGSTAGVTPAAPAAEAGTAAPNEAAAPDPVASKADPIASKDAEIAALRDELLRRRAEFENYKRRVERDQKTAIEDGVADVLTDVVSALDSLDAALAASGPEQDIRAGVAIIARDLKAALSQRGVTVDDPVGQPFDPTRHQALAYEPAEGFDDGVVSKCFRRGYSYRSRLVRAALVQVAQADRGEGSKEQNGQVN
jgi:molecular chaperone GrpE